MDEKNRCRIVWTLDYCFGHTELMSPSFPCAVFVLVFSLFAMFVECTAVAGAILLLFFDLLAFLSLVLEEVAVYFYFESIVVAY